MNTLLLILLGGGMGSVFRYLLVNWSTTIIPGKFPGGVLLVNATGSLIIGILWGLSNGTYFNDNLKAFIFIGLLGGFTTFSSFSLDTVNLFENKEISTALLNIALSNIVCLACCYTGYIVFNR